MAPPPLGVPLTPSLSPPRHVENAARGPFEIGDQTAEHLHVLADQPKGMVALGTEQSADVSRCVIVVTMDRSLSQTHLADAYLHDTILQFRSYGVSFGSMTTLENLLTPRGRGADRRLSALELRCYSEYSGMLTRPAWELLGRPAAIGFGLDDRGYSIVPLPLDSESAVRVHPNRKVSLGVITAALKDAAFPLVVTLVAEQGRLRFGAVRSEA